MENKKKISYRIKLCSAKDLDGAAVLFRKTTAEPPEGSEWTERQAWRFLARIKKIDPSGCYVAVEGGRIIGGLFGCHSHWKDKRVFQLEEIFVSPEYRRKGVGRALFNRVVRAGRKKTIVWLYANKKNPSVRFYKALGMKVQTHVAIIGGRFG